MKRWVFIFIFIPFFAFSLYREGEVLVKVKDKKAISSLGISILKEEHLFDTIYKLSLPSKTNIFDVISALMQNPDVIYAEPNYIRHIFVKPNDPDFNKQWGLSKVEAEEAWDIEKGTENVVIAILDTGVDYLHPDLANKVIKGYDFVNRDNDPMDDNGHGTHVAGIAAALTNNRIGIAGLAWGCKILAVKCLDFKGYGKDDDCSLAIKYAADNGVKVINMSFGGPNVGYTLKEACDYAYNKGCLLVAAAGNYGTHTKFYPAAYDNVLAVGATNSDDEKASFSNYGTWVNVGAPGDDIYSTKRGNTYGYMDGTSMASPFVAGLAGLLFSRYQGITNSFVFKRIILTQDNIGRRDFGRINAYKSLYPEITQKPTVYPNPFIWHRNTFITFGDPDIVEKRLPSDGRIRIYNIKGELVDELFIKPEDNGQKRWYVKEKDIASGVYLYVINKKAFGKIGIIK